MNRTEAAMLLAGVTSTEKNQASAPTNLHLISGEVSGNSEEGVATVAIDGLVFSEADDQYVEMDTLGGLEDGDMVTILLSGEQGGAMTPLAIGSPGSIDRISVRVSEIEADYVKTDLLDAATARIGDLEADHVAVEDLNAATARIGTLETDNTNVKGRLNAAEGNITTLESTKATITDLNAATARIGTLEADHVSASDFEAEQANIDNLQAATADIDTIRANSAKVANLTAAELEADHATIGALDANYAQVNLANVDNAWIENGTVKDGAITNAMINSVSANKLTAGTIDASNITVTNLNADNITTGTINGQRIGEGSLSLDKLSEDVYTESEVNNIVEGLNDRIDGAIETHTGTTVPTLNNAPASAWNTTALRDEHVGDVYYVVNSQSQQNGYCYRFTKSGSTYSWQLIKDSDVTAALSRLQTAEGKITTFDSDISTLKTDTGELKTKTQSLETRMSDAEADILDKVDTTTFNEVSDTVDQHSQTISQHTTAISNKADSSTVSTLTNRVSKNEQDISGINTTIGELQETVESKADGSTVSTISNKLNTVSDTVDGHTQKISSVENTLSTKADSSTVSTLTTKVNNVSDTVDGHTSQLSSITTTQTTMQGTLDKTVKSSIQLWYSKANTTAPSKPTSKVTSTSTSGNAWRIVVPAYNSNYPHYYYCWQYEYADGTYGWSAVVRDIAMGESQSTARTADSNASAAVTTANTASTNASTALTTANTANTNASDAKTAATTASTTASEAKTTAETAASDASTAKTNAASAVSTANSASTTATNAQNTANANIKSSVQLWFTKANSTAPSKPTSVVSTSNANKANAWNLVVPVWNKTHPHYFYCYQQQKGDGTYQWTDVVYDRATSEAQQLANTTSTSLSTLQTNYATFKQQTEQFESTVGTTYATKTELGEAVDNRVDADGEFLYRTTGGGQDVPSGRATARSIKGRTLGWNQLIGNETPTGTASLTNIVTKTGDAYVFNGTTTAGGNYYFGRNVHVVAGHKYLIGNITEWSVDAGPNSGQAYLMLYDKANTTIIGRTNAVGATIATAAATVDNADFYINANKAGVTLDATIYPQLFDLTQMFGSGNEPSTVAEFEALFPEPYYSYDVGSLLPVKMEGIESVGFNLWDEVAEDGYIYDTTGKNASSNTAYLRSKNYIPCVASTEYRWRGGNAGKVMFYDARKGYISYDDLSYGGSTFTTPTDAAYMRFWCNYPGDYHHDICINISNPTRNGEYEPYWSSERAIPASTYFPDGMRSAGSVYDELTEHEAIHRVGSVTLNGSEFWTKSSSYPGGYFISEWAANNSIVLTVNHVQNRFTTAASIDGYKEWTCYFDRSLNIRVPETVAPTVTDFVAWLAEHPVTIYYALATPTTTPIDPALNLTYKAAQGGTERIMVDATLAAPQSAPVPMLVQYGINIYEMAAEDALRTASIESRVTTAETSIEQNSEQIALRATKTEAYQLSQPNLTPYFSHSINDVYSSANNSGYWLQAHATVPTVTNDWSFEQSGPDGAGGWAHFDVANTGTSTAYLDSYIHKAALDLKPSTEYTFLVEWFDVISSGGTPVLYTTTQHGGTNGANDDYFSTTTSVSIASGSGSKYISATTRATLESGCNNRIRTHLWVGKGTTTSGYIRISLYEGKYSGPYKPYVDQTLSNRVKLAETSIEQNSEQIALKAKKMETIDGNMLYDVDAPNLTKIFGPASRYFSDSGNASFMVCDIRAVADSPATGIEHMAHWSVSGSSAGKQRGLCFYNGNYIQFVTGQKYILSCWVRCTSGKFTYCNNAYNTAFPTSSGARTIDSSLDSGWQFVTTTVTATRTQLDRVYFIARTLSDSLAFECDMCGFKMVPAAYATQAELKVANDEISSKVSKDGVISSINQSAESVKIQASKVEIDGTAVFNAAKSKLDAAYDAKGTADTVQTNLDNLEIGGRNLLLGTGTAKTCPAISLNSKNYTVYDYYELYVPYNQIVKANDLITVSFDWSCTSTGGNWHLECGTGSPYTWGTVVKSIGTRNAASNYVDVSSSNNSGRVEVTFKATSAHVSAEDTLKWLSIRTDGTDWSGKTFSISNAKAERGNKATDWSPAPEDVDASIETASGNGFYVKWDENQGTTGAGGEARFYAYDPVTKTKKGTDGGWVLWNGVKRTVPSTIFNPNTAYPYNIPIYFVLRLSSATSTTGTIYAVWHNGGWKSANPNTAISSTISDWTWAETTDIVLASCVEPASEAQFTDCQTYDPPLLCTQVTTITTTAASAQALATTANTTANNAAPKANAVKRTQRIWYRKSASGAPSTPGTASSNWVTKSDDGNDAWTKMHVAISSTHKYIYTCEQYEMANGTVGYTSVLLDNTITVIDGGNIITGTVTANEVNFADATGNQLKLFDPSDPTNYQVISGSVNELFVGGESVASFGASARLGKSNGDRVVVDSTNGVEVYGSDGSTSIASFGSDIRLGGESSPHICIDNYGIDMFDNNGGTGSLQEAIRIDSSVRDNEYAGGRIQFSPSISNQESVVEGSCTPTSSYITIDAMRLISDTWYGPSMSMASNSNGSEDNFLELRASTSANYSELTIYPTRFDFMNSDVNVSGGSSRALSVSGDAGNIYLRSTASNVGLSDDSGDYLIRKDTSGNVYLNGHNVSDVDDHKFFAAPSGGGDAYFREIWASDIPNGMAASKITSSGPTNLTLNSASQAYSSGKTPKYRKWGNVVSVYGAVSPKTQVDAGGTLAIGTLPSGYRPPMDMEWLCQGSGNSVWLLSITTAGVLTASRYRNGASANAAMPTSAWLTFSVTFIVG